jgi:osmotically-inducible protein OsmY
MNMKQSILGVTLLLAAFTVHAFEISDLSEMLFEDTATGVEGKIKDANYEFRANRAILLDKALQGRAHLLVSRNRGSVLVAGQVETQALKERALSIVLRATKLKWKEGDVNNVEPANARVCSETVSKVSIANERRRAITKTAVTECSTVNRFYNEIRVAEPLNEVQQSDDEVQRATIVSQLLHASIIDRAGVIKVVVSDGFVYLLGDELSEETAERATELVSSMPGVEKVSPLFRF